AASQGRTEKVKQLLANGADIEERGGPYRSTPLHIASLSNYEVVVLLLLERGAEVSPTNKDGETPLHYAALGGHTTVGRLLLAYMADGSSRDKNGRMPLHFSVNEAVALLLLEHGADVSAKAYDGRT
ncbi:ankyrin repeat-containing domain protein, partial [Baffinella frigidus]